MNTMRNRLLLAALAVVGACFFGDMGYRKLYEEPANAARRKKDQVNKQLNAAKLELARATRVSQELENLEQRSLPWDPQMARSRYQAWLLQLVKDARLTGTTVDSGEPSSVSVSSRRSRKSIELYKRFTFTVRGRGDLGQVTRFLYDFYNGGHLQKIRSISLVPGGVSQTVNMTVAIEALAVPSAEREASLSQVVSDDLAFTDLQDYQLIARRNFFGRGGAKSSWKQLVLTAVTTNAQGDGEAWFSVGANGETQILLVGDTLAQPSFDLRLERLDQIAAIVLVDGQPLRMTIGHSLAEAAAVTPN